MGVPEQMRDHLTVAAEAVRAANRLTHEDAAAGYAGRVSLTRHYAALGAVAELLGRLPQFLDHLRACADRVGNEPGRYRCDGAASPATRLVEIEENLRLAAELLIQADRAVNDAWSGLGTLAYLHPDDDPDDEDGPGDGAGGAR